MNKPRYGCLGCWPYLLVFIYVPGVEICDAGVSSLFDVSKIFVFVKVLYTSSQKSIGVLSSITILVLLLLLF